MRRIFLPLVLVAGCESDALVAEEMQRALTESSQGLLGALVSAEFVSRTLEEPDVLLRHDPLAGCGCPCVESLGAQPTVILTLIYPNTGCIPESGLVPSAVTGDVSVVVSGDECEATSSGSEPFRLSLEHALEGTVVGSVAGVAGEYDLVASGAFTVGDTAFTVDVDATADAQGITFDGEVTVEEPGAPDVRPLVLSGVSLAWADIGSPCARPHAGTATWSHPESSKKDSVVDYGEPGDGFVTVSRKGRVSEATDYCAYESAYW